MSPPCSDAQKCCTGRWAANEVPSAGSTGGIQPLSQNASTPTPDPSSIITARRVQESPHRPLQNLAGTSTAQQTATVRNTREPIQRRSGPAPNAAHSTAKTTASTADEASAP